MSRIRNVKTGSPIQFLYAKSDGVTERSGVIESVRRTQGKSSIKVNRKPYIVFNVVDTTTGDVKSYHFHKMSDVRVTL